MSAYVVEQNFIAAIVRTAQEGPADVPVWPGEWTEPYIWRGMSADTVGKLLFLENIKSVQARYGEDTDMVPTGSGLKYQPGRVRRLNVAECLGALDCYEYQACEHEAWPDTEAHTFVDQLRHSLIAHVTGYEWCPRNLTALA